jgi:hypothetical protein
MAQAHCARSRATGSQAAGVPARARALWLAVVRRDHEQPGGQPRGVPEPRHRGLDLEVPLHHAGRDAAARDHRHAGAGTLSPHAGLVRLLLRRAALSRLQLVRHGVRPCRHRQGHPETAVHPGRVQRLPAADAIGGHVDQPGGEGLGRGAVAGPAQAGLRHRQPGHPALLLDARRQEQFCRCRGLRGHHRRIARMACPQGNSRSQRIWSAAVSRSRIR